jgi:cephalosporin hydroxylase
MVFPQYGRAHPIRATKSPDERFLAASTGLDATRIRSSLQEPFDTADFLDHLLVCDSVFRQGMASADLWAKKVLIQYAAVLALRPETIVETGVASGVSSAYFLLALARNQKGTLHSVELGDSSYLPPGRTTGWVVPDSLRARWQLHISDSAAILPDLLGQLGRVDMFIHDSLHTYENMKVEFALAYPYLKRGDLLLADDALWNAAFADFATAVSAPKSAIIRGLGILKT